MDKIAANNHVVTLKKEIKKAKAMVSGNLIRRIKELKAKKDKLDDEAERQKIDNKVERIFSETKLMQSLDTYPIAKNVILNPDKRTWDELLSNNKSTPEQRLTCRLVLKNNVQKCLTKFRFEHKDCDEWLSEYFEYREKKKQLLGPTKKKKRDKKTKEKKAPKASKAPKFRDKNLDKISL